jgi:hypothetical protein
VVGLALGTFIGMIGGYYGGRLDDWLMRVVDIMFAFPGLILAIVIAGLLGPSRTNAMLAIGIVFVPPFARVVRGSVLAVMQEGYIEAVRVIGVSDRRMIRRYVLPNITAAIIVMTSVYLSSAILTEAGLSYLGLGTQPPEPSWGGMLSAARNYMELSPWMALFPGAAIMFVVLGFNPPVWPEATSTASVSGASGAGMLGTLTRDLARPRMEGWHDACGPCLRCSAGRARPEPSSVLPRTDRYWRHRRNDGSARGVWWVGASGSAGHAGRCSERVDGADGRCRGGGNHERPEERRHT